jgi:hypothetical protein
LSSTTLDKEPTFNCFVGVDQTGAVQPSGKPKPLPCAVLIQHKGVWNLRAASNDGQRFTLPSFSTSSLSTALRSAGGNLGADTAILADCVFGLPWRSWRRTGQKAGDLRALMRLSADGWAYGRRSSEAFFSRWAETEIPMRECERIAGSNSIFKTRPFQKNIQTGTFRIWRDLATYGDEDYFSFWPFDAASSSRPWVFEGYPSYYWYFFFGHRYRSPLFFSSIIESLQTQGWKLESPHTSYFEKDPNLADAGILCLAGLLMQKHQRLFQPFHDFGRVAAARTEGWIAGVVPH